MSEKTIEGVIVSRGVQAVVGSYETWVKLEGLLDSAPPIGKKVTLTYKVPEPPCCDNAKDFIWWDEKRNQWRIAANKRPGDNYTQRAVACPFCGKPLPC